MMSLTKIFAFRNFVSFYRSPLLVRTVSYALFADTVCNNLSELSLNIYYTYKNRCRYFQENQYLKYSLACIESILTGKKLTLDKHIDDLIVNSSDGVKNQESFQAYEVCLHLKQFTPALRIANEIDDSAILFEMLLLAKHQENKLDSENDDKNAIVNLFEAIKNRLRDKIRDPENSTDIRFHLLFDPNPNFSSCKTACERAQLNSYQILRNFCDLHVLRYEMDDFPFLYALSLRPDLRVEALFIIVEYLLEIEKISPNGVNQLNRCLKEALEISELKEKPFLSTAQDQIGCRLFNDLVRANSFLDDDNRNNYVELAENRVQSPRSFAEKLTIFQFLKLNDKPIPSDLWTTSEVEISQNLLLIREVRYPHAYAEFLLLLISVNPAPAKYEGSAKEIETYKNLWAQISESKIDPEEKIAFVDRIARLLTEANALKLEALSDNCFQLYLDHFKDIKNSNDFHIILGRHLYRYAPRFREEQNLKICNELTGLLNTSFDSNRKFSSLVLMKKICRTAAITFLLFTHPKIGIPLNLIDKVLLLGKNYYRPLL